MIHIISTKNHYMRTFLRMHGFSQEYMAESVSSISQFLTDGGVGPSLYLTHKERQLESTSNRTLIPSSFRGINTPTLAHLERNDHYTVTVNEVDNLSSDTVDDMLRDMVAPVLNVSDWRQSTSITLKVE